MTIVDGLAIYRQEPRRGPFPLLVFETAMKTPSDISLLGWKERAPRRWADRESPGREGQAAGGPRSRQRRFRTPRVLIERAEEEEPPSPRALRRMEQRAAALAPSPDPRLASLLAFHAAAKEVLDGATYAALTGVPKGAPANA